jgi:hypothetical protein
LHIDLRVPVDDSTTITGFAGLTKYIIDSTGKEQLEWRPEISYPTLTEDVDAGFVHFDESEPGLLIEQGLDGSYEEEWMKTDNGIMKAIRIIDDSSSTVTYTIEGDRWKAQARGPLPDFNGICDITVWQKSDFDDLWIMKACTSRIE